MRHEGMGGLGGPKRAGVENMDDARIEGVVEMDGEAMGGRFLCEAKSGDMPKAWRPCQKRVPPKPQADFPASEAGGMAR